MKKEYLKLKKMLLTASLIPLLTSCNSKEVKIVDNDNKNKTDMVQDYETETPIVTENISIVEPVETNIPQITSTPVYSETVEQTNPVNSEVPTNQSSDEQVINYFDSVNTEIDELLTRVDESGVKEKIFANFIKITDFLFCGGEIKGVTANDISETTKQKLSEITGIIDTKIDSKIPGYKDILKDKYYQVKTYIENSETLNKIEDGYNEFKEDVSDKIDDISGQENTVDMFWDSVKEDAEDVKDMAGTAKEKVKEKYDDWSQQYRK